MHIIRSLIMFIWASWLEIGGGYLIWQWLKAGKPVWYAIIGGCCLALFGIIAALQAGSFGRVYAAYGGIFIAMSLMWGWKIDDLKPDRYDLVGGAICIIGALIIMYSPRE